MHLQMAQIGALGNCSNVAAEQRTRRRGTCGRRAHSSLGVHREFIHVHRPAGCTRTRLETPMQESLHGRLASYVPVQRLVRFGGFRVELASETLWREGSRVRTQQRRFRVFPSVLERPGAIVSRPELCPRLRPAARRTDFDSSLITGFRKVGLALGDSSNRSRHLETLRGRGYRLQPPVERVELPSGHSGGAE
jgi:DNA-binding winged helix-turn-helix (wHTH) protein